MKNLFLALIMLLPLTTFNSCNEDDNTSLINKDFEEINFKSATQQEFYADKETKYLLDFINLSSRDIIHFSFMDNFHKKIVKKNLDLEKMVKMLNYF